MSVFVMVSAGMLSMLAQMVFLRGFLNVFAGNELDIGITLSVWFIAVGVGSLLGSRLHSRRLFAWSFVVLGLLLQPSLGTLNLIRLLSSREFGEVLPLSATVGWTLAVLTPTCLVIGVQFPLAVRYFGGRVSRVYGLEGAGAFIGGLLFTFAFAGNVDAAPLMACLSSLSLLVAVVLFRLPLLSWPLIGVPLIMVGHPVWLNSGLPEGMALAARVESRYGEIKVVSGRGQSSVYSSGKFLFAYPDPQSEEMRSHLPMTLHPSAERVLVLGGSPAVARELLKYPLSRIDFVESDPELIGVSWGLLDDADRLILSGSRLEVVTSDAGKFVKDQDPQTYDLVLYSLPDPSTANINRFYTEEFFREVKRILRSGGIVVLSLQKASGYLSKRVRMLNGSVYAAMARVFAFSGVSSEEYGVLYGSDGLVDDDPRRLEMRFVSRHLVTTFFRPYILRDAFDPVKVATVKRALANIDSSNTDMRPVAYLYSLLVWAEIQDSVFLKTVLSHGDAVILSIAVLFVLASVLLRGKTRVAYLSFATVGFSSIAFSMVIILSYQAQFGFVYEMIGLLSALFMAGIAVGAVAFRRFSAALPRFRSAEFLAVLVMGAFLIVIRSEPAYYVFSALNGLICGAGFSAASDFLRGCGERDAAGKLYAVDLGGSFLGAILISLFTVPLMGIPSTVLFVVLMKAVSLAALFSVRHDEA